MNKRRKEQLKKFFESKENLTNEELAELYSWINNPENTSEMSEWFSDNWKSSDMKSQHQIPEIIRSKIEKNAEENIKPKKQANVKLIYKKWLKVAAAILLPLAIGLIYFFVINGTEQEMNFVELETGIGGDTTIVLSDNTEVQLHALTKIRYPEEFSEKIREIELWGEAYFNVAKDKNRPFIVKTSEVDVEVLGTSFNITAYENDPEIITTLLTGKVKISSNAKNKVILKKYHLQPNQQAVYSKGSKKFNFTKVDTKKYIAWREGELIFENETLGNIMKKLERWYGISIRIEDTKLKKTHFTGTLTKEKSIEHVLKLINITTPISYSFKHDSLLISKTKQ